MLPLVLLGLLLGALLPARRRARHGVFHVKAPIKKHVENSIRGIITAARRLFAWIDLDLLITKADPHCPFCTKDGVECRGHIVVCHWDRPMIRDGFFDPLGLLDPHTRVRDMTLEEVLRLRTKDGYRIWRVESLLGECALKRIGAFVEPKDDPRFELDWPWQHLRAEAVRRRCRLKARTIRNFPTRGAGTRRAAAARRNHVRARTIH